MIVNYFLVALRRLLRNRMLSVINIGGLAIGFAAVTLIGLYVNYELSYNRWLPNVDALYKVEFTETEPGHAPIPSAMTPAPLAAALVKDFSGIEDATRLKTRKFTVRSGANQFTEELYFADPNFFALFDLPVVLGQRADILKNTGNIALSETAAKRFFGDRNPIGQILNIGGREDRTVVAVLKDLPANTHLDIQLLTRISADENGLLGFRDTWGSDQAHTYIKVNEGFDPIVLEQNGRAFAERNITLTWTKLPPADLHHYNAVAVADLHLYSDKDNHEGSVGDIDTVVTFALIASLVLALAVVNFANLSTANALRHAREVALRKVLGASSRQIMVQFLGEAVLTAFLALLLGLVLAELTLFSFGNFLGKDISLAPLYSIPAASLLGGTAVLAGVCGGFYPSFVLSRFRPTSVLSANKSTSDGVPWLRNSLVVLQFSVSVALIASTAIIYRQTDYVRTADLGFDPAGKVIVPISESEVRPVALALKNSFSQLSGVRSVAMTTAPLPEAPHGLGVFVPQHASRDEARSITQVWVDADFFPLMGQSPLAGRLFAADRQADLTHTPTDPALPRTRGIVLNQSAATLLGYGSADQAINQQIITPTGRQTVSTVVGVVPDIHLGSLYKEIEPMAFFVSDRPLYYMIVELQQGAERQTLAELESIWNNLVPGVPMSPTFLEQAYRGLYQDAERQAQLFGGFSLFAVLVACLGLYGLASYAAVRRIKEVGIRKVLGARVLDIVLLLTWQFSRLVALAIPIGVLVSASGMSAWLDGFAYRISLLGNSWVFLLAALAAFMIAWLTVGGQAASVARRNPIRALRYE
ncbi:MULTISPECIES: ABC transporter permease [Kordiimonas]|jgi:putative ABC transport system permease protein|uniref:ABC transporter permease n=1 Tax=Kordiimonas TaxID=288021 RepID=UPI00257E0A5F|nr:ABC transporter permease [Kordiimonas sp. UBA4487]